MVLKQEVINAFNTLGLDPASTTVEQATTAYKKLALKHHPDRNFGDSTANERFQEASIFFTAAGGTLLILCSCLMVTDW